MSIALPLSYYGGQVAPLAVTYNIPAFSGNNYNSLYVILTPPPLPTGNTFVIYASTKYSTFNMDSITIFFVRYKGHTKPVIPP